jgi:Ser/Thr protein kinase RdoA (MazF antagonist)
MEHFYSLVPEAIFDAVEAALGQGARATGRCLSLHSMENRVYDIELEDERRVVAKFYRPGRWSREAILDEHRFLSELHSAEVPAVPPLPLGNGETVASTAKGSDEGIFFALFPKVRGRSLPKLSDEQLLQCGRFLARLHNVGALGTAPHRPLLSAEVYGGQALSYLLKSGAIDIQVQSRYERAATAIVRAAAAALATVPVVRLHGDCHLGNLLWQDSQPFFIDFDDMLTGPAVQDIWMAVRGRDDEAKRQRAILLSGYEQLRHFDHATLRLIEPLRGLRMVHFSAWIARRFSDPTFQQMFSDFTTYRYWQEEVSALEEQLRLISAETDLRNAQPV